LPASAAATAASAAALAAGARSAAALAARTVAAAFAGQPALGLAQRRAVRGHTRLSTRCPPSHAIQCHVPTRSSPYAHTVPSLPLTACGTLCAHFRCELVWADPTSRLHDLWGSTGWRVRQRPYGSACWGDDGERFFEAAWEGTECATRNWYTGNEGDLGDPYGGPASPTTRLARFTEDAPAVLGFDESIDHYCVSRGGWNPGGVSGHAISCVRANANILSLYGDRIPYNTCRNSARTPDTNSSTLRVSRTPDTKL
jgi:hypothetical protein